MRNWRITTAIGTLGMVALLFAATPERLSAGEAAVKATAEPNTVQIDNFAFAPGTLTVIAGTTVTWKNDDDAHSVREKDGKFKSAALDTDDTFSQTFTAPGEYEYFCSIHPRMVGKIIVKPAGKVSSNERRAETRSVSRDVASPAASVFRNAT